MLRAFSGLDNVSSITKGDTKLPSPPDYPGPAALRPGSPGYQRPSIVIAMAAGLSNLMWARRDWLGEFILSAAGGLAMTLGRAKKPVLGIRSIDWLKRRDYHELS